MERSSKHSARVDDQMDSETEAIVRSGREPRVEEHREMEPAGEDQPVPDALLSGDVRDQPYPEVGHDELELRADIARHLRKSVWPANRQVLVDVALDENAPARVVQLLSTLDDGREYENLQDVWHALGHQGETHRF